MSARQTLKPVNAATAERGRSPEAPEPAARREAEARVMPERIEVPAAKRSRGKMVGMAAAVAALLAGASYGAYYWSTGRFLVSTDDAYVGVSIGQISARVPARVAEVRIEDNQKVALGEPLVILDDADYRLAVEQAKARLETQKATVERIGRQIEAAKAAVVQALATRDAADADLLRSEADFERTSSLAANQFSSRASLDAARATRDKARAALASAKAGVSSAETNVAVLEATQIEAERTAAELKVAVDKAARDLDGTIIRAPVDGVIGNRSVQVGDYLTAGKRISALVPLQSVYVDANFKETQLAGIKPGQTARVSVDAAGGIAFEGIVRGVAPASGSQFSLLPPENATGNFTKIVQRVPVRIEMPKAAVEAGVLRPGLSVVVTVDTRAKPQPQAPAATPVQVPLSTSAAGQPTTGSLTK